MLQQARADLLSRMSIQDAVEVSVTGAVDGKDFGRMLDIMEAAPGEDLLWGLIPAIVLGPHDVTVPTVQPQHFPCSRALALLYLRVACGWLVPGAAVQQP